MSLNRALSILSLVSPALASGSLRGAVRQMSNRSMVKEDCDCASDLVCCAMEAYRGDGVLVKMLGRGSDVEAAMDGNGGTLDWNAAVDGYGVINDCTADIADCSAWNLLQQGLVPMAYNYPDIKDPDTQQAVAPKQHMVGLMVAKSAMLSQLITRGHVVDGDTWSRYHGGLHPFSDWAQNLGTYCPGWEGSDLKDLRYVCVPVADDGQSWCNADTGRIEVPIGAGGSFWSDIFLYSDYPTDQSPDLSKSNTMIGQCEFQQGDDGELDWEAFVGGLKSFYAKAVYQQQNGQVPELPDGSLYLENEVNMETAVDDLMPMLRDDMLAVVVQTNPCTEQLVSLGEDKARDLCYDYYHRIQLPTNDDFPEPEDYMVDESKRTACRLAQQLTSESGKEVPVLEAKFSSGAVVDIENWQWYTGDQGAPENFLTQLDCCGQGYVDC